MRQAAPVRAAHPTLVPFARCGGAESMGYAQKGTAVNCRHPRGSRESMVSTVWLRLCLCLLILCGSVGAGAAPGAVVRLQVDGVIGPAGADYLVRGLAKAVDEGAQLVVIEIETPGGLDTSMRAIIKAILASPIPLAARAPPGAT